MYKHPEQFLEPAKKAAMKVPKNPLDYDTNEYPHFSILVKLGINREMSNPYLHEENARVLVGISDDQIKKVNMPELFKLGFKQ